MTDLVKPLDSTEANHGPQQLVQQKNLDALETQAPFAESLQTQKLVLQHLETEGKGLGFTSQCSSMPISVTFLPTHIHAHKGLTELRALLARHQCVHYNSGKVFL